MEGVQEKQTKCKEVIASAKEKKHIGASANLELVDKFCYLGDMLSVEGDADSDSDSDLLALQPEG